MDSLELGKKEKEKMLLKKCKFLFFVKKGCFRIAGETATFRKILDANDFRTGPVPTLNLTLKTSLSGLLLELWLLRDFWPPPTIGDTTTTDSPTPVSLGSRDSSELPTRSFQSPTSRLQSQSLPPETKRAVPKRARTTSQEPLLEVEEAEAEALLTN